MNETVNIPLWVLEEVADTIRQQRNLLEEKNWTSSCLWRMTNKSINLLSCYIKDKATDENLDKILSSYNEGKLLKF